MLDLNKVNEKLYEIKMVDGEILQIKKPSQNFLNKLIEISSIDTIDKETLGLFYSALLDIFNLNVNGKTYNLDYVAQFDVDTVALIISDYLENTVQVLGE